MDLSETRQLLALISAIYQDKFTGNELLPAVWQECLSDIDALDAAQALKSHIKTNEWPPQISHIRAEVLKLHRARRASDIKRLPEPVHVITDEERARNRDKIDALCRSIAERRGMRTSKHRVVA